MPDEGVLEWHRVGAPLAVVRRVLIGAGLLSLGPLFAVIGIVLGRTTPWLKPAGLLAGGAFVVTGPIFALLGLVRVFREDGILLAKVSGVTFERNGKALVLAWDELDAIECDGNALVFKRRAGDPFVLAESFTGISRAELASRLEGLRRKASFHLL